jgi:hypothetical protein
VNVRNSALGLFAVFSCNICRLVVQDSSIAVFRNTSKLWELVVQGSSVAVSTKASKLWELVVQDSSVAVFRKARKIWELCLLKALLQKSTWSERAPGMESLILGFVSKDKLLYLFGSREETLLWQDHRPSSSL